MPDESLDESGILPRFDRHLRIVTRVEAPGVCAAELALTPEHRNIEGRIHGGVYLTLLDTAMGHAIASLGPDAGLGGAATMQFSCQFLRPPTGELLQARGTVLRLGRTSAFVEGILRDERGTEVARAHGVWRVWRGEAEPHP
ncbi:MAG TPA: PaaI family thioesterase [Gemmatimonadota bacterium]|jgi:acyl-CoA thioesterase